MVQEVRNLLIMSTIYPGETILCYFPVRDIRLFRTCSLTATASLTVSGVTPVNGQCATPPNGGTFASAPTGTLCNKGTASPSTLSGSGPWNWSCVGSGLGSTNDTCNAQQQVTGTASCGGLGSFPTNVYDPPAGACINSSGVSNSYIVMGNSVGARWSCDSGVGACHQCASGYSWDSNTQECIIPTYYSCSSDGTTCESASSCDPNSDQTVTQTTIVVMANVAACVAAMRMGVLPI